MKVVCHGSWRPGPQSGAASNRRAPGAPTPQSRSAAILPGRLLAPTCFENAPLGGRAIHDGRALSRGWLAASARSATRYQSIAACLRKGYVVGLDNHHAACLLPNLAFLGLRTEK